MNIFQGLEWLQSQGRKLQEVDAESNGMKVTDTERKLTEMVNVQTGLISQLNEELLQLRSQHVEERKILQKFMDQHGFNYPP